ncbi:MAG: LytR C-terminal domain-containing protein [Patescibacteria group bacterium]|nr:LytR C-terminal domain-containing protein [Patescibacteria group bacterium]
MKLFSSHTFLFAFLNNATLRLAVYDLSASGAQLRESDAMTFPESVVRDSGVVDVNAFGAGVDELLAKHPSWKRHELMLVIPEEKMYVKGFELELGDLERKEELTNDFLDEVPFRRDEIQIRERLVGRVFELAVVEKDFLATLQQPFLDAHVRIAGIISVPHALALELQAEEKSFLIAFYDNDIAMMLAENTSILFSETRRLVKGEVGEAMEAFDHFVAASHADRVKSVSLILGDAAVEDALKTELESRRYHVKEVKKVPMLDLVATYIAAHQNEGQAWNLLVSPRQGRWRRGVIVGAIFAGSLAALTAIGWLAYALYLGPYIASLSSSAARPAASPAPAVTASTSTPAAQPATTTPAAPAPAVSKADFPIAVLNGTTVAGEAGRLRSLLTAQGFTVSSVGNNSDQTQVVTTLFVSSDVPDTILSGIRVVLEAQYQNVLVNVSPVTSKDIHIVIGKKK